MTVRLGNTVLAGTPEFKNYTTNRILEIPQDIKLELNNGTLTLKAGSKLYDGTGYSWVTQTDMSRTLSTNNTYTFVIEKDKSTSHFYSVDLAYSQNTQPSTGGVWFNTDTNAIKWSNNATTWGDCSLPIGIVTVSGGAISSIDQIFNGVGYIGSTAFVLPNVKVQIPNGRNEDGTCKCLLYTISTVLTKTNNGSSTYAGQFWFRYNSSDSVLASKDAIYFNEQNNTYEWQGIPVNDALLAEVFFTSGKITSFTPYTVDLVANSNMSNISSAGKSFIAGMGMPSSKLYTLTLGTSGSTYVAPANGYVVFGKAGSGVGQVLQVNVNGKTLANLPCAYDGHIPIAFVPVRKGDTFKVFYTVTGGLNAFNFIYADGEQ